MSLVDIPSPATEDKTMDPVFKDYVDVRIESAEARSAASMAEFKTFVTAALVRMEERDAARQRADDAFREEIQKQLDDFRKESRMTRKIVVATGITVLFGIAGINAAMMQNFHSAFDIDQRYSNLQNDLAVQSQKTTTALVQMDGRLAAIEKSIAANRR